MELVKQDELIIFTAVPLNGWRVCSLTGCQHYLDTAIIQRFKNKVLRNIIDAPWYVRNADLHRDLKIETVTAEIKRFARKHEERLLHHEN